jgi:hypothetical protein
MPYENNVLESYGLDDLYDILGVSLECAVLVEGVSSQI